MTKCILILLLSSTVFSDDALDTQPPKRQTYIPIGNRQSALRTAEARQDTTVLYRRSSGEVIDISEKGNPFDRANSRYYSLSINPVFMDGTDETIPKIVVAGQPDTVRNATTAERTAFADSAQADAVHEQVDNVFNRLEHDPIERKRMTALARFFVKWRNAGFPELTVEEFLNAFKNEVQKSD